MYPAKNMNKFGHVDEISFRPASKTGMVCWLKVDDWIAVKKNSSLPGLKKAYRNLLQQAEKNLAEKIPDFLLGKKWWTASGKIKEFNDTYPEINKYSGQEFFNPCQAIFNLTLAYKLTGKGRYYEKIRELFVGMSKYRFVYEHYDTGLNYAIGGLSLLQSYSFMAGELSDTECEQIENLLSRCFTAVRKCDDYWIEHGIGGINNHYVWHKLYMAALPAVFNSPDKKKWINHTFKDKFGVETFLKKGFLDTGLTIESSFMYHYVVVQPLCLLANILKHNHVGPDLWSLKFKTGHGIKDTLTSMLNMVFPDRTVPPYGDCYANRHNIASQAAYEIMYAACKDPKIAWLLSSNKERTVYGLFTGELLKKTVPPVKTMIFKEHAVAVIRTDEGLRYWSGRGPALFVNYDYTGCHSHHDKPGFMVYGNNRLLIRDCEAASSVFHKFSARIQAELNRTMLAHNLVIVDETDHGFIKDNLDFIGYKKKDGVHVFEIGDLTGKLYPGVSQKRTFILTKNYLIDFVQVKSGKEHVYDYIVHIGDETAAVKENIGHWSPGKLNHPAASWLIDTKSSQSESEFCVSVKTGETTVGLYTPAVPGTVYYRTKFPVNDKDRKKGIPTYLIRRICSETVYPVLYNFDGVNRELKISCPVDNFYELTVKTGSGSVVHNVGFLMGEKKNG
jgi:hypothetical protein